MISPSPTIPPLPEITYLSKASLSTTPLSQRKSISASSPGAHLTSPTRHQQQFDSHSYENQYDGTLTGRSQHHGTISEVTPSSSSETYSDTIAHSSTRRNSLFSGKSQYSNRGHRKKRNQMKIRLIGDLALKRRLERRKQSEKVDDLLQQQQKQIESQENQDSQRSSSPPKACIDTQPSQEQPQHSTSTHSSKSNSSRVEESHSPVGYRSPYRIRQERSKNYTLLNFTDHFTEQLMGGAFTLHCDLIPEAHLKKSFLDPAPQIIKTCILQKNTSITASKPNTARPFKKYRIIYYPVRHTFLLEEVKGVVASVNAQSKKRLYEGPGICPRNEVVQLITDELTEMQEAAERKRAEKRKRYIISSFNQGLSSLEELTAKQELEARRRAEASGSDGSDSTLNSAGMRMMEHFKDFSRRRSTEYTRNSSQNGDRRDSLHMPGLELQEVAIHVNSLKARAALKRALELTSGLDEELFYATMVHEHHANLQQQQQNMHDGKKNRGGMKKRFSTHKHGTKKIEHFYSTSHKGKQWNRCESLRVRRKAAVKEHNHLANTLSTQVRPMYHINRLVGIRSEPTSTRKRSASPAKKSKRTRVHSSASLQRADILQLLESEDTPETTFVPDSNNTAAPTQVNHLGQLSEEYSIVFDPASEVDVAETNVELPSESRVMVSDAEHPQLRTLRGGSIVECIVEESAT